MRFKIREITAFILIIIILALPLFSKFKTLNSKKSNNLISTYSATIPPTNISEMVNRKTGNNLKDTVDNSLMGIRGIYGIVIKNFKTGENYFLNEHREFDTGSLYKIWVMAVAYNRIQNGELKEDEILSEDVDKLNQEFDIDPDTTELTDGTISLTVKDALIQMITISHNYAALLLSKRLTLSEVKNFLEKQQFKESSLGETPKTTPNDIALFFKKLYNGELADKENTEKMINLLKRQTKNGKLPKYLPEGVEVAHKTGEFDYFSHDAGIVFSKKGDYIIVILSLSDFPPGAEERIALVSKAVFEYFER